MPLLLVVHRPANRALIGGLVHSGFQVAEAASPEAAVERAVALAPDLIVLDFDLDGDLVHRLRLDEVTKAIPIVALTGPASTGEARGRL